MGLEAFKCYNKEQFLPLGIARMLEWVRLNRKFNLIGSCDIKNIRQV